MRREIQFYKNRADVCPIEAFLDALPSKVAQKVAWVLQLAEELERVPLKYFAKLADTQDIWEFRIKFGSDIYRIFAFQDGRAWVLTHGFLKKTQKTPQEEIKRAQQCRIEYFQRKGARS